MLAIISIHKKENLRYYFIVLVILIIAFLEIISVTAPTGLVAYWNFDESSGTTAADSSGNGKTATLVNGPTFTAGRFGNAVNLDGIDDYVIVANPNLPTGDFTYEAWINPDTISDFHGIMVPENNELEFDLNGNQITVFTNEIQRFSTSTAIPTGAWTHVALTRQGSAISVYFNGVQDSQTGTDAAALTWANCGLLIGVDADSGCTGLLNGFFDGKIDEIRIYNRALSQAEIQSDMNTINTPRSFSVSPTSITFTKAPTGPNPPPQSLQITVSAGATWSTFDTIPFADASPVSGIVSGTVTLTPSAGMIGYTTAGTYADQITVSSPGFPSIVVPVTLVVTTSTDTTPPIVSITAPLSGATVSSTVTVSATASDNIGVAGVQFRLDGVNLGAEDTTSPYSISWNTSTSTNGAHTLTAVARDAAGNTATSTGISVTVNNILDTTPPTLSNGQPTGTLPAGTTSATLSLTTNEAATCKYSTTPNIAYASMPKTFTTTGSTSHSAIISGFKDGATYTYYIRCQDILGNANTNDYALKFSISALLDKVLPSIVITAPLNGVTVSGVISISANATDNLGISGVIFKIDGIGIGTEDDVPYSILWSTSNATNGLHTITAEARDTAGNMASASVTVSVSNVAKRGDINGDNRVTTEDIVLASKEVGKVSGLNPKADLAPPYGKIDLFDVMVIVSNLGS